MSVRSSTRCSFSRVIGILTLVLLGLSWSAGQEQPKTVTEKVSINGTVTDQTGAVVAGAKVALTNEAGEKLETQANEKGEYSFTGLKPGTYTLRVTAPNFAVKTFDNITLTPGLELTLDAPLEPASIKEEVNVESGGTGKVETESAEVSGTITEKEVVSIGLNGRNFTQLIALAPGVSNQTGQDEAKVGVVGSVKYSVNGGRVEYNTFEVDGSDVLNTGLNGASSTLMVYPSLDAIQEVKVLTSNYGAQFGRTASGTVQVTTKSGTNKWHGNLYDFVRNEAFNSRNFFDIVYTKPLALGQLVAQTGGQTKAPLYRRQDFGGTIGGPLTIPHIYNNKKGKTFFFYSEEFRLEKTPTEYNQAVPGLKERGLILKQGKVQQNLQTNAYTGATYQDFDFSDVCPLNSGNLCPGAVPGLPVRVAGSDCWNFHPSAPLTRGRGHNQRGQERVGDLELEPDTAAQCPLRLQLQPAQLQSRQPRPGRPQPLLRRGRVSFHLLARGVVSHRPCV